MGIFNRHRCAICSSKNKKGRKTICEECLFVLDFVVKYGRENLRSIINNVINKSLNASNQNISNQNTSSPSLKRTDSIHSINIHTNPNSSNCGRSCKEATCSCHNRESFIAMAPPYN